MQVSGSFSCKFVKCACSQQAPPPPPYIHTKGMVKGEHFGSFNYLHSRNSNFLLLPLGPGSFALQELLLPFLMNERGGSVPPHPILSQSPSRSQSLFKCKEFPGRKLAGVPAACKECCGEVKGAEGEGVLGAESAKLEAGLEPNSGFRWGEETPFAASAGRCIAKETTIVLGRCLFPALYQGSILCSLPLFFPSKNGPGLGRKPSLRQIKVFSS